MTFRVLLLLVIHDELLFSRLLILSILFIFISLTSSWSLRKAKLKLNSNDTCCILAKLNINATRANSGRQYFANIILNNDSYKDINEDNICSLMHFFMQEAVLNGRPIEFSKGMFVLYDSTKEFFTRLMMAKDVQKHGSDEHRSGYFKRIKHFAINSFKSIFKLKKLNQTTSDIFICVRGDESSHFRERAFSRKHRKQFYPAYGMDVKHGCMPNGFGHILFGKLKDLYDNQSDPYYGDRIYIKPEEFGLQKFKHYIRHVDEDSDEIDAEDSEVPEDLEDDSEDSSDGTCEASEKFSTDEDDWQEDSDVSSVENESEDDSVEEQTRNHSRLDQQSSLDVFRSKSGRHWDKYEPPQRKIPQANILRQQSGIGRPAAQIKIIKDAFQLLFTEDMVSIMVRETNRRAKAVTAAWNEKNSQKKWQWKDTNNREIWALIGLLILGSVQRSQNEHLDELWSTSNGRSIFRAALSKNRMNSLLRFCRFDDAATRNTRLEADKLAAISEFWALFLAQLQVCYVPGGAMTVDEQLTPTRGRCRFRQYMRNKPAKYGIKICWCCDSKTAYPLKGEVYIGCQAGAATNANKNGIKDLVKQLVAPWINKGRSVTTDNYFTSVLLAEDLLGVQTTLVGTIRKNKPDIPQELQPSRKRPENSSEFCFDRQLTLVSYVPKKNQAVILLSSMHHDMTLSEEMKKKPEIILYYNETKGGVDHMDQMVQTYSCKKKINRWPMSFFFHMVDVAGIVAFIIRATKNPQWNDSKLYRRRLFLQQLGRSLVDDQLNQRCQDPRAFQQGVRLAMRSVGLSMTRPTATAAKAGGRRRYHLCPRSHDRKIATQCSTFNSPCCSSHHKIICDVYMESFNEDKKKKKE